MRACLFVIVFSSFVSARWVSAGEEAAGASRETEDLQEKARASLAASIKHELAMGQKDVKDKIIGILALEETLRTLDPKGVGNVRDSALFDVLRAAAISLPSQTASGFFVELRMQDTFKGLRSPEDPHIGRSRAWLEGMSYISSPSGELLRLLKEQAGPKGIHSDEVVRALARIGSKDAMSVLTEATAGDVAYRVNVAVRIQEFRDRPTVFLFLTETYIAAGQHRKWVLDAIVSPDLVVPQKPSERMRRVPPYTSICTSDAGEYLRAIDKLLLSLQDMKDASETDLNSIKRIREIIVRRVPEDVRLMTNMLLLIRKTDSNDVAERRLAVEGLGKYGAKARAAIPVLRDCLRDEDQSVRKAAQDALDRVWGDPGLAAQGTVGGPEAPKKAEEK